MNLQTRVARLERLLALAKRIAAEQDIGRLLDLAMQSAIEFTDAERGFVLLREADGAVRVRAAQNLDRDTVRAQHFRLSRSIADRVMSNGEAILSQDVIADERFRESDSIHDTAAKSILAIPIRSRDRVVGVVYLDKMRQGLSAFDSDDLGLLQDFGDVAAIAVEMRRVVKKMEAQGAELGRAKAALEQMADSLREDVAAKSVEIARVERALDEKNRALGLKYGFNNIVGRSPPMLRIFDTLSQVMDYPVPVLITGESGTGKELVARALHHGGARTKEPFMAINCTAIPENLLESELFGYQRGAFTGATADKEGLFVAARNGTVFLDEIGEMPVSLQGKLLRVLQEREVMPVGGRHTVKFEARVVAATNRDLKRMVSIGAFREDLFYRLNVVEVTLPPLRERVEDIPTLAEHFLRQFSKELALPSKRFSPDATRVMVAFPWQGNVRQLENAVKSSAILSRGELIDADELRLPETSHPVGTGPQRQAGLTPMEPEPSSPGIANREEWETHEKSRILDALVKCGWNKTLAAQELGFSRRNLYRKLERYGIERSRTRGS